MIFLYSTYKLQTIAHLSHLVCSGHLAETAVKILGQNVTWKFFLKPFIVHKCCGMDAFENARRRQLEKSLKIQALTSAWRTVYILVKLRHWKNIDAFPALLKTVLLSAIFIIIRRFCIENSSCGAKDKVLYRFQGNISALQFRGKYLYELQTKRGLGQQGEGWGYL